MIRLALAAALLVALIVLSGLVLLSFALAAPGQCVSSDGRTTYDVVRFIDDGTLRGRFEHLGCPGEPKALPVPGGDPVFTWTGDGTGTVAFYGPGTLEKHRGAAVRQVFAAGEGLFVVEVPAASPADVLDRPSPGDLYCVGASCVEVRSRTWLALPWIAG